MERHRKSHLSPGKGGACKTRLVLRRKTCRAAAKERLRQIRDLFIGMDSANICNMLRIFGGDLGEKVHKLMDYTERGGDVADPWYSERFDVAYRDIYDGCAALLDAVLNRTSNETR